MTIDKKDLLLYVSAIKRSLFYCKLDSYKAEAISMKTVCFIFYNFLSMSRSGFFNKVPGQSIFRGATSRSLVMVMLYYMPIAAIFWHFLKIVASYLGGVALCHGPTFADPLQKSKTDSKGKPIF